jgi:hypothetical protein
MIASHAVAVIRSTARVLRVSQKETSISCHLSYGASVLAMLALTACSYSYPIEVSFIGGRVAFSVSEHSSGCLNYLEVKSETGQLMWRFEGPLRLSGCRNDFPLIYGATPRSATSSVPAKKLLPDVRYYIAASDGDSYYGSFRVRRILSIDSDPVEGRNGPYFNSSLNGVDGMTVPEEKDS